jgi:predicted  nucleic acid-binding Zn-ribbon protein
MRLRSRRHPADVADLSSLQHKLEQERAHSAHLARQLAEAHETARHLVEGQDHYRGRCRELVAEVVSLKAELRGHA